jgi:hypothetical protein
MVKSKSKVIAVLPAYKAEKTFEPTVCGIPPSIVHEYRDISTSQTDS